MEPLANPFEHLFRFGHLVDGEDQPFSYPNIWERDESLPGRPRLVIGAASGHLQLILELAKNLNSRFCPLYILAIPCSVAQMGRYDTNWMSHDELSSLFTDFRDLLERDGRHELWIGAVWQDQPITMFAYDQHQQIYAYGPINDFEAILLDKGFERGKVSIPVPHSHHYRAELEGEISRFLGAYKWRWTELDPDDES